MPERLKSTVLGRESEQTCENVRMNVSSETAAEFSSKGKGASTGNFLTHMSDDG
jgi:hypothetical protein